jgi:hypothetical protein
MFSWIEVVMLKGLVFISLPFNFDMGLLARLRNVVTSRYARA